MQIKNIGKIKISNYKGLFNSREKGLLKQNNIKSMLNKRGFKK